MDDIKLVCLLSSIEKELREIKELSKELVELKKKQLLGEIKVVDTVENNDGPRGLLE